MSAQPASRHLRLLASTSLLGLALAATPFTASIDWHDPGLQWQQADAKGGGEGGESGGGESGGGESGGGEHGGESGDDGGEHGDESGDDGGEHGGHGRDHAEDGGEHGEHGEHGALAEDDDDHRGRGRGTDDVIVKEPGVDDNPSPSDQQAGAQ